MIVQSKFSSLARRGPIASLLAMVLVVCSLASPVKAQALPEVLSQMAPDAEVIVIVPNMAASSKKISQFFEAMGMKDIPEMSDPLGAMKREMGIDKGFDEKGAMLISMSGIVKAAQGGGEPAIAVLVPVSDYAAFVGNFEGKEENGITLLSMPHGQEGFARKIGNYCLMGPQKDVIANYKVAGNTTALSKMVGSIGARHLASNDISLYINMKALGAQVRPMLGEARKEAERNFADLEGDGDGPEAKAMAMGKGLMAATFDTLDAMFRDGDSVIIGGDLTNKGVGFTVTAQFREGSPMAKMFPGGKGAAADMLAMIPNNPYLMAMAMDMKGIDLQGMVDEFAKRFPKDNWMAEMLKSSTALLPQSKRMASVYYAPANAAAIMAGGLSTISVVDTTGGANYTKAAKKYFGDMSKIKMDMGEVDGTKLMFGFTTSYKENALSPEAAANVGAKVDEYVVKLDMPKELMDQMGEQANMINMMLRTAGYVATVDDTVMMTSTVDTNLLKVGVDTIKKKNGLGTTSLVKQVRENGLPENSNFEIYVNLASVTQLLNQGMALAQMFGVPQLEGVPQIEVPNNLPPMAMGGQIDQGGMSMRTYIPMPVITWIKDTAMKFQGGPGDSPDRSPGAQPAPF